MKHPSNPTIQHQPKQWTIDHVKALASAYSEDTLEVLQGSWFRYYPNRRSIEVPASFEVLNRELLIVGIRHECMHSILTTKYHSSKLQAGLRAGLWNNALMQTAEDVRIDCHAERQFPKARALHRYLYSRAPFAIPADTPNTLNTLVMAVKLYGVCGFEKDRLTPAARALTERLRKTLNTKAHCEVLADLYTELKRSAVNLEDATDQIFGDPGPGCPTPSDPSEDSTEDSTTEDTGDQDQDGPGAPAETPAEDTGASTEDGTEAPSTGDEAPSTEDTEDGTNGTGSPEDKPCTEDGTGSAEDGTETDSSSTSADGDTERRRARQAIQDIDEHFRKTLEKSLIELLTDDAKRKETPEEIMDRARTTDPLPRPKDADAHSPDSTDTGAGERIPPTVSFSRRPYAPDRFLDGSARDTIARAFRRLAPTHTAGEDRLNSDVVEVAIGIAAGDVDRVLRADTRTTGEELTDYGRLTLIIDTSGSQGGNTGRHPTPVQSAILGHTDYMTRYDVLTLLASELYRTAVSQHIDFRVIPFADDPHVLTAIDYQKNGTIDFYQLSYSNTGQSTENFSKVAAILDAEHYSRPELFIILTDGCWRIDEIRCFVQWRDRTNASDGKHVIQIGFAYPEQLRAMAQTVGYIGHSGLYDRFIDHSKLEELAGYITSEIDRLF